MTIDYDLDLSAVEFDPSITFDCGQAFRWHPLKDDRKEWVGLIGDSAFMVTKTHVKRLSGSGHDEETEDRLKTYFSMSDDINKIKRTFPKDKFLALAASECKGLRLLRQDPWECLISFICSINSNIPSIRLKIENLSKKFGKRIDVSFGPPLYTFPNPDSLARAEKNELLACKTGFRWKYIKFLSERVASGELDLQIIERLQYREAANYLVSETSERTFGVGPKVADCVLLFSYHKLDVFPIDVWITRCIKSIYLDMLKIKDWKSLSTKRYYETASAIRAYFGPYSGYAQQYLYTKFRNDAAHSKNKAGLKGSD